MQETLYNPEKTKKDHISLTEKQKEMINNITLGISEVDENITSFAVESGDVIKTLENGHPLNRILTGENEETIGYIACEDFIPHEAYLKYFGTNKSTNRNLLQEIPAFLEYAKQEGYTKINFHGWNNRLNKILTRYGFERIRTDNMASYMVDFYEKSLGEQKSSEEIIKERMFAFEQKYLNKINKEYSQTLATFGEEIRKEKEEAITEAYKTLARQLTVWENFEFKERQQAVLKLKLARYFQREETIDTNVLFDAIIESPKFIDTDKGGLHRLFEIHQEKTLQKIAEMRKRKAEQNGEGFNPYEALFTTKSGNYYMARLLNMPHLKEESAYMSHCVGTSDSYVNKIKHGEVEILSFRKTPTIDKRNNKLNSDDTPLITIEYNLKTKTIEQVKKENDEYLSSNDPYYEDVIDAFKQLRTTETDTGELRDFKKISDSELENFEVKDYHLLTENGEVHFKDFDPDRNIFVLKMGTMDVTPETPKTDAVKIMRIVEGVSFTSEQIAYKLNEITKDTKAYIGPLESGIFEKLPSLEYVYTSFPDKKIQMIDVKSGIEYPKTKDAWVKAYKEKNISPESGTEEMLEKMERTILPENQKFIRLTVADLGFDSNAEYQKICTRAEELGLELCEQDDGPKLRLSYDQPIGDYYLNTAMKSIEVSGGHLRFWCLDRYGDGETELHWSSGYAVRKWHPDNKFVFRIRKSTQK